VANVLKNIHDLRHLIAMACCDRPFFNRYLSLKLRLRELQKMCAEFMDFFSAFAGSFVSSGEQ
jgi:hypothetical protein